MPDLGEVVVYPPAGQPAQVVLLLSGDGGWEPRVVPMAERLQHEGALVVGIDIRPFVKYLEASATCADPPGVLDALSRDIQARYKLPAYLRPIVVGYSSGATMAYAALVAAQPGTFKGAMSLGFCPDVDLRKPLCQTQGLRATAKPKGVGYDLAPFAGSTAPWVVVHGEIDQDCLLETTRAFVNATGAARLFPVPGMGHGFATPPQWERQFLEAYHVIVDAETPRDETSPPDRTGSR